MNEVIFFLVLLFIYLITGAFFVLYFIRKNTKSEERFNEMIKDIGWLGYIQYLILCFSLWPLILWLKFNMSTHLNELQDEFKKEMY